MALVVDASVALKWVLDEPGADRAHALLGTESLLAPDFLWLECANVLALKVRRGQIAAEDAREALQWLMRGPVRVVPTPPHLARAQAIAMELGQTAYDSLYLATALAEGAVMVTDDAAFTRAAGADARYSGSVRAL